MSDIHNCMRLSLPRTLNHSHNQDMMYAQNPAPGLQVFQPNLPYAETDSDFHLCPLPRYTCSDVTNPHGSTQKQYLDREVRQQPITA